MIVSVVTPSFNQGAFLAETIESVLGQGGDFSIDYIVVDGESTDDSVDIIRRYDRLLKRGEWAVACRGISFRWLSEKDRGQAHALAKGFRMATGDVLAWLNSDDLYLPGALQAAADFFRGAPETGLVYGEAYYCDRAGAIIGSYRTEPFSFQRLAYRNFICQPSAFFRREVFLAVGGVDESLRFAMDYDLWIRLGAKFPCRHLAEALSVYRLHESSKTICDRNLFLNSEEGLRVATGYYGWAPMTRVYNSCSFSLKARLPKLLARMPLLAVAATVFCTLLRSFRLNRGFDGRDLSLLNRESFRKLFRSRLEIMTGKDGAKR